MTIHEFDNTKWHCGISAVYKGTTYKVGSVNFAEKLIGLVFDEEYDEDDEETYIELMWVRCEYCELLNERWKDDTDRT